MKKIFFLFLMGAMFSSGYSQKKYAFDYMLVYDFKFNDTSKVKEVFFYTNSKDNSYLLRIYEKDSLNCSISFKDQNGIQSKFESPRNKFLQLSKINLSCEFIRNLYNPFKYQTDNYEFINKKYALMEGEYHPFYILKSNNPKREKKKKLATFYYYLENDTEFHFPLLEHETAYEEWKLERNIPNGIPKEMYYLSYGKVEILMLYKLKRIVKIDKILTIPEDCNFKN